MDAANEGVHRNGRMSCKHGTAREGLAITISPHMEWHTAIHARLRATLQRPTVMLLHDVKEHSQALAESISRSVRTLDAVVRRGPTRRPPPPGLAAAVLGLACGQPISLGHVLTAIRALEASDAGWRAALLWHWPVEQLLWLVLEMAADCPEIADSRALPALVLVFGTDVVADEQTSLLPRCVLVTRNVPQQPAYEPPATYGTLTYVGTAVAASAVYVDAPVQAYYHLADEGDEEKDT